LPVAAAREELDAEYLPPVAQGDLYRATLSRPSAIGIVDGYFHRVPSVWHKEILWALSQGIYVFGAASLGALRAAELASFGMIGVGHVFKAFHDGELEDDDEVAIMHAPADQGYRPLSDAMVDIRATLTAAVKDGVISEATRASWVQHTKELPYPERSYRRILATARAEKSAEVDAFEAWLAEHRVGRKRSDALMLLRVMKGFMSDGRPPYRAKFHFEHTDAWEEARSKVTSDGGHAGPRRRDSGLLDEVRLSGSWERVHGHSLARALVLNGNGARLLSALDPQRAEEAYRVGHDLYDTREYAAWRAEQKLSDQDLQRFFVEEAAVRAVASAWQDETLSEVPNYLRSSGELSAMQARAMQKADGPPRALVDFGLDDATLFRWYFEEVRVMDVPLRIDQYAVRSGFEDLAALAEFSLRKEDTVR
jgi:hypothetical protein